MYDRFIDEVVDELAQEAVYEVDEFDPTPPQPGTTLLTRFAFGGARLTASHRTTLVRIAADIMRRMPATQAFLTCFFVDVEGHEDEVGDPARFGRLGVQRGVAAAEHLAGLLNPRIVRLPAADRREVLINVTSAGPTRPIRSNVTEAGRAMNRRVEIRVRVATCPGVV